MQSLSPKYLSNLSFTEEMLSSLKTIGEYKGKQKLFYKQTPEILESMKQVAMIESVESSNRIEGITAPHKRIEGIVLKSTSPKDRPEEEIAGYREALDMIHDSANYMKLNVNLVLQIHSVINRFVVPGPSRFKSGENKIVEKNPDGSIGKVRFEPVSAFNTPRYMEGLVESYNQAINQDGREPMVVIPLFVLDFLCIHPFGDGNGRVSRLLTLMLLYHFGYEVGRFISLERVIEESKETYYECLQKSSVNWHDAKHDPFPWMRYFWGTLIRSYGEFEERVGEIRKGRGSKTEQVEKAVARFIGPFSISELERECAGISRVMIKSVLQDMNKSGKINLIGKGRGAMWIKEK